MINVLRTSIITLFLFSFYYSYGQDHYRVFEYEYEYASNNDYDSIKENSIDIREYEANLSFPIKRENGDAILTGIGFNNLKLFPNIQIKDSLSDTLYSGSYNFSRIRVQAGYSKNLKNDRSLVGMIFFRIASDMIDVNSKYT